APLLRREYVHQLIIRKQPPKPVRDTGIEAMSLEPAAPIGGAPGVTRAIEGLRQARGFEPVLAQERVANLGPALAGLELGVSCRVARGEQGREERHLPAGLDHGTQAREARPQLVAPPGGEGSAAHARPGAPRALEELVHAVRDDAVEVEDDERWNRHANSLA